MHHKILCSLALCALVGCADDDGGRGGLGGDPSIGLSDGGGSVGDDGDGDGGKLDLGGGADDTGDGGPPTSDDDCASVSEAAEQQLQPVDIVFVVDNSGSMDFETAQVQAQLNGFSNLIIATGIDVHVALISSYPGSGNGICIDPPLGSGGCPGSDNNAPTFIHVNRGVGSHDSLDAILQTFGDWKGILRPEASHHFVVVTDDESNLGWQQFDQSLRAKDPMLEDYSFHSVVCHTNCASAADIGSQYLQLSAARTGVTADLCDQNFFDVFQALSMAVISTTQLGCDFEIPPPPDGMEFDPNLVNVEFDDGQGGVLEVGRVDSPADCANVTNGWYYDDPVAPTQVRLCAQTCDTVQTFEAGSVSIAFGCGTKPAG